MNGNDLDAIAAEAMSVLGTRRPIAPFSTRFSGFELSDAYQVTAQVRSMRERAGEAARGRKIGFTNRAMWAEFGVGAPSWGYMYDRTVHDIADISAAFSLAGLAEPRIEPEIAFGLASAPRADMDPQELLRCIDWVALGFELVQSIFPGWRFAAADAVAAFGMHGVLLLGRRQKLDGTAGLGEALQSFEIDLYRNGELADRGAGRNVLDGPVLALKHLVDVLAADPFNPPLSSGEIVTTGSLTRALPIGPGETWTTKLSGLPLEGATVRFS
jgi:2-oxo-3-hexenedioate decarboxylase